ncbi:PKD domain-containing protein [Fulvivirga maritima]|uniref:PKD domain-containing protein n=1 Tax=Fulvivirga maritima TaxID=2904247 RepID=UPI001F196F88|nr:PKD domain-containing protein [Fulvivirga maritima]UII27400.1 PKD domain-containing protein [Fulvivirga maritima]
MKKTYLKPFLTTFISLAIFLIVHSNVDAGTSSLDSGYVCDAGFTYVVDTTGVPTYTFTANETDPELTYSWNFGNQWYASGREVEYIFYDGGGWNVYLTVSDGIDSCTTYEIVSVIPIEPNQCYFNYEKVSDSTLKVSSYSPYHYEQPYSFDFGDGTVVTDTMSHPTKEFSHTYDTAGTYQVCFYIANIDSDSCSYCKSFTMDFPPAPVDTIQCNAGFTYKVDTTGVPTYTFTADETDPDLTYSWNFGNQWYASGREVEYIFYDGGGWNVYLTVSDGIDSCTTYEIVSVIPIEPNQCYFNYEKVSDSTLKVSSYSPYHYEQPYSFDFGDGTVVSDTMIYQRDFYHTYDTAGTYQVCFYIAYAPGDTCSYCNSFTMAGSVPIDTTQCDASFTFTQTDDLNYLFNANQRDSIDQYTWRIDGTTVANTLDLFYTFPEEGLYTVSLNIGDSSNNCYYSESVEVKSLIDCSFSYDSLASNTFQFYTSETGDASYLWDFGDGNTSDSSSVVMHTFSSAGIYNVCLTKTNLTDTCQHCNEIVVGSPERDSLYIEGSVYADLLPVFDGTVELYKKDSIEWEKVKQVNLSNGYFRFSQLTQGQYILYARGDEDVYTSYIPTYFVNGMAYEDAYSINLNEPAVNVNITLIKSYSLSSSGDGSVAGRISLSDDSNDPYVVLLKDQSAQKVIKWTMSNDKNFSFETLPYGTYQVTVEKPSKSVSKSFELTATSPNINNLELGSNLVSGVDDQLTLSSIGVYPTQIDNKVIIANKGYEEKALTVHVRSATGDHFIIQSIDIGAGSTYELPLPGLPSGLYLIQLNDENGKSGTFKVIKP